ncbi:hypothetical protein BN946_scf184335.g5 [Trametes cinnabarina]|uniref:t-SNARE coiled-coil homology domain-containing protein n=1 Tax=Pycnoporus cinnabarinus TaxID=5643 RepID=A0A060ST48_PYCCI|nr:hypothetical protein BN946_scf184335.g5 [Trametes cinnabarina]
MATLAKLTSLSTQTLSLLLERQRLQNMNSMSLHTPQIAKNLEQLRVGILEMESREGVSEASRLLRSQHQRMRGMLGPEADAAGIQRCEEPQFPSEEQASGSSTPEPEPLVATPLNPPLVPTAVPTNADYAPYTDDPEAGYLSEDMLLEQRRIMEHQDVHLDDLSRSISRQRDISLQINDELDVHTGLLEGLDLDLDRTDSRLTHARRRLDRVARGAKENGSTLMIGLLILVLLILIIVFKT